MYVLHWENGKLESANGNYIRIDKLNPRPTFTEKEALEIWCNYQKIPANEISRSKIELLVVDLNAAEETKAESKVVLAYRIRLYSTHIQNWLIGYIDAHTGEVCLTEPIAITATSPVPNTDLNFVPMPLASPPPPPATGTFATRYSGAQNAITESRNNQFFLEDRTRANGIITRNRNNLNAADTTGVTPFADNNNNWTAAEWDNAAKDNAALDIHWALQRVCDYYLNVHGRRGWDSLGQRTNAYVHALILTRNGLTRDNAAYYPDDEYLAFGDGESTFKPLASVDIVAHEYAHGINDHTSGFNGDGIIRSFNEGLSDIWAAAIEGSVAPQKSRWKIGEEVMLTKSCLRNLMTPSDPTADWPIAHTYGTSEYNLNSEPYYRSGILSHWFYLLSEGGAGTNGLGNSYRVYGLGIETAARLVYFAQAGRRLNGTTTYPLMRTNMMNAADALFGTNSFQSLQVANAWYAVGVGSNPGQVTLSFPDFVCYSGSVFTVNNPPSGSTISWVVTPTLLEVYSGGSSATPTIRAKSSSAAGEGEVVVKFTSNGFTTSIPAKSVYVGKVEENKIVSSRDGMAVGAWAQYHNLCNSGTTVAVAGYDSNGDGEDIGDDAALSSQSITGYEWSLPSGWSYSPNTSSPGEKQNERIDITPNWGYNPQPGELVQIGIRAQNDCGWTNWKYDYWQVISCGGYLMAISPNPATNEATIELVNTTDAKTTIIPEWEVSVFSPGQVLKEKVRKIKDKTYKINTQGWQDGVYIVRAIVNGEPVAGKLVVKH